MSHYSIESGQASIACAKISCRQCRVQIEAIALYCTAATIDGEAVEECSVMHITAMDESLQAQLARWPFFTRGDIAFCNRCPHCGTPQSDIDLHSKPGGPFFRMDDESRKSMTMVPLTGTVRLSGEEIFQA